MITDRQSFLKWFRDTAPYIREHSGKTFVIQIDGELIASNNFQGFIHDIALLNTLGIKLVIVFGTRPQVEKLLNERGIESNYFRNLRVTDRIALECFKEVIGLVRFEIEAMLSMGLPSSPMANSHIIVSSGNFISAKPIGVIDGVDMQFTGSVRRVDGEKIKSAINHGNIVLLSSLGTSVTGEILNLRASSVATHTAVELKADKLIFSFPYEGLKDLEGKHINELMTDEAEILIREAGSREQAPYIQLADAVEASRGSVGRVHMIDCCDDSSLLIELFSRDGIGTLVSNTSFDSVRKASNDDIAGILELIAPLEQQGKLVSRDVQQLKRKVGDFTVLVRDGTVIACIAACQLAEKAIAEISCVAVHPDYRNQGKGSLLFRKIETELTNNGVEKIFVLTTQAAYWFVEQGFTETEPRSLPEERLKFYDHQRNSKVLVKNLR